MSCSDCKTVKALLWVHAHFQTGYPCQVEPIEWYGRLDVFDYLTNGNNIGDISIDVPLESWVRALVKYELDDGDICSVRIILDTEVAE